VEFGFLLGDGKKIGEKVEFGAASDGSERRKQRGNILGRVLRLYFAGGIAGLAFVLSGRAAMGQMELAAACIHDWQPQRGSIRTCFIQRSQASQL
jgi:hypothetical protein